MADQVERPAILLIENLTNTSFYCGGGGMSPIAVVGAGPKAVAIMARAKILQSAGIPCPTVHVFERAEVGASWTGNHGYTNGHQRLCTPAQHDRGFPYRSAWPSTDLEMYSQFSWARYCFSENSYGTWVARGCRPPRHSEYAKYLDWAARKAAPSGVITPAVVRGLAWNEALHQWEVTFQRPGEEPQTERHDGVVITGTLPPRRCMR